MASIPIPPPGPDEYAPFYRGYIAAVLSAPDVRAVLREQAGRLRGMVEGLGEEEALRRYEPGKWSVKEVVGHVADSERIFGYRLLRLARGDETPLPGFD